LAVIASDAEVLTYDEQLLKLPDIKKRVESMRDMIISTSQGLRRLSLNLRPPVLDNLGLVPALRWLVDGLKGEAKINAQLKITGKNPELTSKRAVNIFRIVQESLNNVRQHSEATHVSLKLVFNDNNIMLTIQDNGKGFLLPKSHELTKQGKLGLIGMKQRAQFMNGTISFQSKVGTGTKIHFVCPANDYGATE